MNLQLDFVSDWVAILYAELGKMGYTVPAGTASKDVALLFFNALFRRIPQKPRKIWKSRELQCPPQLQNGLNWLEQKVVNGDDLNPHLSRKITALNYDDALLNDWHIFHFHLGTTLMANGLVQGTDPVLFARVTDGDFFEICTASHGTWADTNLVEILHTNWPESIKGLKLPEAIALEHVPDTATIEALRKGKGKKGKINTAIQTKDGTIYGQFGGGYTSLGKSLVVVNEVNRQIKQIRHLEKALQDNPAQFLDELKKRGYSETMPLQANLVQESTGWYASFPQWNHKVLLRGP